MCLEQNIVKSTVCQSTNDFFFNDYIKEFLLLNGIQIRILSLLYDITTHAEICNNFLLKRILITLPVPSENLECFNYDFLMYFLVFNLELYATQSFSCGIGSYINVILDCLHLKL